MVSMTEPLIVKFHRKRARKFRDSEPFSGKLGEPRFQVARPDFIRSGHFQPIRLSLAFKMRENPTVNTEPASDSFLRVITGHRQWLSVKAVCEQLISAGFDAVLAGGCVRDALLGITPKDFDVATSATPDDVEKTFPKTISVGKNFGVVVVPLKDGGSIEVATYRRDGDYEDGRRPSQVIFSDRGEDAKRRDFTVNAMFFDPVQNTIIDYANGREDLKNRILRVVGDPELRFKEDKLRLLRAVRFQGQLGFEIEEKTKKAVAHFAKELSVVSRERIRDEVDKMLVAKFAGKSFLSLCELKLSPVVFADWESLLLPPHKRVFTHPAIDIRRILLFWPAFKTSAPDRIQERLQNWKYGRAFIDLVMWTLTHEEQLRPKSKDPVKVIRSRDEIIRTFKVDLATAPRAASPSPNSAEWMATLELWTNEKAIKACQVLDLIYGTDRQREASLLRRGLLFGHADPDRAMADDLKNLIKSSSESDQDKLSGPLLGRELKRLNREILLRE